ncbi:hypothetical protein [Gorillibacterium sp. sgz5001074]|uniref:hypothetical protein n=1 Tax=Gorillibacterium sp. sgz5001074 TaxID=3446695 RepID=UPI003F663F0F
MMEVQLVASFPNRALMQQAIDEIRSQGAIDVRLLEDSPSEEGLFSPPGGGSLPYALSVWMERSRYRLAEDAIRCHRGSLLPGSGPSLVLAQNRH